ncbi:MAG: hypothetical protein CMH64_00115 [Nanoarchaeota archaeon]|nr:hypothetical protein [Nanoarchaeota archaeon]
MKAIATIKLKLPNNNVFLETMKQYSYSANKVIDFGWNIKTYSKRELHDLTYHKIREETQLPAQLVCSSRDRAFEVLKACKFQKSKPIMKEYLTIRYDSRSFSFRSNKNNYYISLTTINGRIKFPVEIPECYWKYLDYKVCSADLILDKKERLFLNIVMSRSIKILNSNNIVGVDLGINNIAVTSQKQFFNSSQIKLKKLKFKHLKAKLQAKGTKSAKKLLKKISGREKRFMTWVNHNISKSIINKVEEGTIVLEELKGIRKSKVRKKQRFWLHSWSFYQLQRFIEYKAVRGGIKIIKVNPRNTSKICNSCGNLGSRCKSFFTCSHCGYSLNADLNASFNLAKHTSISDCVSAEVIPPFLTCDTKA